MKKWTTFLAAFVILCLGAVCSVNKNVAQAATGSCGSSVQWELDESTGVMKVTGSGAMTSAPQCSDEMKSLVKEITMDDAITVIYTESFVNFKNLEKVKLPARLTKISKGAFGGCEKLQGVVLPESLTEIEEFAFNECQALTKITIPKGIKDNGKSSSAFQYSGLTEVTISEGVTKIPDDFFVLCKQLKTVYLPSTLTEIGKGAFGECTSLANITLPNKLKIIGPYAFNLCTSLTNVVIPASVTTIDKTSYQNTKLTSITGSSSAVEAVAKELGVKYVSAVVYTAVKGKTYTVGSVKYKVLDTGKGTVSVKSLSKKVKSVTIPKSVKIYGKTFRVVSIEKKAFFKQSQLKKIKIKSTTITKMGAKAFSKINKKATVTVPKSKKKAYKKLLKKAGLSKKAKVK